MGANEILFNGILLLVSMVASFTTVAFLAPLVIRRKVALGDAAKAVLIATITSFAVSLVVGTISDGVAGFLASVVIAIAINVFVFSRIVPIDESRTLGVKHATYLMLLSGVLNMSLLRALVGALRAVTDA